MTGDARLLSSRSTDADLLSAAALAQAVGATATADDLKAQAVRNRAEARLAARRARNLADVDRDTNYSFDEAM